MQQQCRICAWLNAQRAGRIASVALQGICFAGFARVDFDKARRWLQQMEPGMRICCVHEAMHYQLLQDAIYEEQNGEQVRKMYTGNMLALI